MSENMFLLTIGLPLAAVVVVFGMKYLAAAVAAKARIAHDMAQASTDAALSSIQAELARTTERLASVEKILKQVE